MTSRFKNQRYKYIYCFSLLAIYLLFFITRLWKNAAIPKGLHIDEAAIAYDAWSLVNFGVDRHLKSWPVYLINFGGGQNVLYCYVLAGLFKIFGFSFSLIRVPAVFFSFLTLTFGILLVRKLFPDRPAYSLLTGALIVICPYFIMAGRFGLESSLMAGMSTVFLYCFVCAVKSGRYRWYFLAGIAGGLTLYTYAIAYLAVPVFLLITLVYAVRVRRFSFAGWCIMAIPLGILSFPLLLVQYINFRDLEEFTLGIFTITKLPSYRANEITLPTWQHFASTLKSVFFWDYLPYNSVRGYANLYFVTVPLAMTGLLHGAYRLVSSVKKRELSLSVYPLFWFMTMLLVMSCVNEPNTNKVNGIFFAAVFLAVDGVYLLLHLKTAYQKTSVKVVLLIISFYAIGFIRFASFYYMGEYQKMYPALIYFDVPVPEAIEYLEQHPQYRNVRTYMAEDTIWFALSSLRSPYDLKWDEGRVIFDDCYYCGGLTPEPIDGYNYIVRDTMPEYAGKLRELGYSEIQFPFYSLFYKK